MKETTTTRENSRLELSASASAGALKGPPPGGGPKKHLSSKSGVEFMDMGDGGGGSGSSGGGKEVDGDKKQQQQQQHNSNNKIAKTRNGEAPPNSLNGDAACNGNGDLSNKKELKKGGDEEDEGLESGEKKGKLKGKR